MSGEQQQSAVAEPKTGEETLSSLVWIACPACRAPVNLSETVRVADKLRLCAACSRWI